MDDGGLAGGKNTPMAGGSPPASTILGPKMRWDPKAIPARAAQSEADTDIGGTISKEYKTEM